MKLTVRIIVLTSNMHCIGAEPLLYIETLHQTYNHKNSRAIIAMQLTPCQPDD
jgi:hypothetical protein